MHREHKKDSSINSVEGKKIAVNFNKYVESIETGRG
jgi:hypothetical protein